VGRAGEALGAGLDGEGDDGAEQAGEGGRGPDRHQAPEGRRLPDERGRAAEQGDDDDLDEGEPEHALAGGVPADPEDVQREAAGAGEDEQVADAGRHRLGGEVAEREQGEAAGGQGNPERDGSRDRLSGDQGRDDGHDHDRQPGDEAGSAGAGELESGRLESVAGEQASPDNRAGPSKPGATRRGPTPTRGARPDQRQHDDGRQGEAERDERQRPDVGERVLDHHKGRAPGGGDAKQRQVGPPLHTSAGAGRPVCDHRPEGNPSEATPVGCDRRRWWG
jgi:hypothetical protein